ncbi:MAG: IS5/IS1182 family transposase, partial [Cyanobacteria bacterium QS_1_48_34]
ASHPSAGLVDAQSLQTTETAGAERGDDAGNKLQGRKRHLLVDSPGLLLQVKVLAAHRSHNTGQATVANSSTAVSTMAAWVG